MGSEETPQRVSLLVRVALTLGVLAVLLPIAGGIWATGQARAAVAQRVEQGELATTRATVAQSRQSIEFAISLAEAGAKRPGLASYVEQRDSNRQLEVLKNLYSAGFFRTLGVFDTNGIAMAQFPQQLSGASTPSTAGSAGSVSPPQLVGDDAIITARDAFVAPSGRVVGFLITEISLNKAMAGVSTMRFGETGTASLVDNENRVLVSGEPMRRNQFLQAPELLRLVQTNREGTAHYHSQVVNRKEVGAYVPMDGGGLRGVLVTQSEAEAFAPVAKLVRGLSIGIGVFVVMAAAVALAITRSLAGYHRRLKQSHAQVAEARDQAVEASMLKSQFVANMSHEIRTPMNGVIGMTDLLLRTSLSREQKEYAETVRSSSEALLGVINDILDFSKIEAGKLELDRVDFAVRDTIEEVATLLAGSAQAKGLELAVGLEPDVPDTVKGDASRLRQILLNLASNAVKFTDRGEVVIHARVGDRTGDNVTLCFEVRDTGPGIADEDKERIFADFTQLDTSSTRSQGGTGLGLAISKSLVQLMGGEIGLESRVGEGSVFWFTAELEVRPNGGRSTPEYLRGLRLLVVDDNATNRTILEQTLWGWDMEPTGASSATQALEKLRKAAQQGRPCDIILLDYHMPEIDGIELARLMVADPTLAPIHRVLLTSSGERSDTEEELFEFSLTKPVRQRALFDCISQLMGPRERMRAASKDIVDDENTDEDGEAVRVLVAEDNPVNQTVARRMLETLGYSVDVVANGAEAVEAAAQRSYSAILMDCQMPELDGYEATRKLRIQESHGRHTPIIAVTAGSLDGDVEDCVAAGMDDYLAKPITLDRLTQTLDGWLGSNHSTTHQAIKKQGLDESVLDLTIFEKMRERAGEEDASLKLFVGQFVSNTVTNLGSMRAAVDEEKTEELAGLANTIMSAASSVGAKSIVMRCQLLMIAAKQHELERLPLLLVAVEHEFDRFCQVLESQLPSNG